MTLSTNGRCAGFTFLLYIVTGVAGMAGLYSNPGTRVLASLVECFSAIVLAVTLHGLTRRVDADIAMLGLVCRVAEGVLGAMLLPWKEAVLRPAVAAGAAPDAAFVQMLGATIKTAGSSNVLLGATLFAVGSTAFCWLLLRGHLIPAPLAWIGLGASVLLVVSLPLQLTHILTGRAAFVTWLPMLAFEVPAGVWMLAKGANTPAERVASA